MILNKRLPDRLVAILEAVPTDKIIAVLESAFPDYATSRTNLRNLEQARENSFLAELDALPRKKTDLNVPDLLHQIRSEH